MKKKNILLCLIFLVLFSSAVCADNGLPVSFLFLKLPVGAAAAGMGEAYSSIAEGAYAMHWNPACLSENKSKEIMFMRDNYIEDLSHSYIGFAGYFQKISGTIGFDISYIDNGDFDKTYITNGTSYINAGKFSARDYVLGLHYSKNTDKKLKFGASLKYLNSKIDDSTANGVSLNLGWKLSMQSFGNDFDYGFVVQNIGTKIKYDIQKEDLPLTVKFGLNTNILESPNFYLKTAADIVKTKNSDLYFAAGIELMYQKKFALRAGYNGQYDDGEGLSLGCGAQFNFLKFDYAYNIMDDLSDAHRMSINIRF